MRFLERSGCRLAYRVEGKGEGGKGPVLLIQGTGIHGDGWRPQVEALVAAGFECMTFDNRGMAQSQPRGAKLSVELMADDALALLDAERWPAAHVVGHSLGGPIAIELALRAKRRIKSLSLLCTFARGRDVPRMTPALFWTGLRTRVGTRQQRRRAFLELVLTKAERAAADPDDISDRLAPLFGHDLADQPPSVMQQLRALAAYDATPKLRELAGVPTLVVSAAEDRIAPPVLGRALAERIPGAIYKEIPGAAHGVPLTRAEIINRLLLEFVKARS